MVTHFFASGPSFLLLEDFWWWKKWSSRGDFLYGIQDTPPSPPHTQTCDVVLQISYREFFLRSPCTRVELEHAVSSAGCEQTVCPLGGGGVSCSVLQQCWRNRTIWRTSIRLFSCQKRSKITKNASVLLKQHTMDRFSLSETAKKFLGKVSFLYYVIKFFPKIGIFETPPPPLS